MGVLNRVWVGEEGAGEGRTVFQKQHVQRTWGWMSTWSSKELEGGQVSQSTEEGGVVGMEPEGIESDGHSIKIISLDRQGPEE